MNQKLVFFTFYEPHSLHEQSYVREMDAESGKHRLGVREIADNVCTFAKLMVRI